MQEAIKDSKFDYVIGHKARLSKALKDLSVEKIQTLRSHIDEELSIRKQLKVEDAKRKKNVEHDVERINNLIKSSGLSLEEVTTFITGKRTRKSVPPKYQITVEGETHYWSGRGVTPKVFRKIQDEGRLEDTLIDYSED